eukprot:4638286-Prymnesium_polylepis.1
MPRTLAPRRPGQPRGSSAIASRRPTFTRCPRRPTRRALAPPCTFATSPPRNSCSRPSASD